MLYLRGNEQERFRGRKRRTGPVLQGGYHLYFYRSQNHDSKMAPTTLGDMLAHEPYNAGRELINAGKFELAIEHFSDLLETTKEASGELSEVCLVYI